MRRMALMSNDKLLEGVERGAALVCVTRGEPGASCEWFR